MKKRTSLLCMFCMLAVCLASCRKNDMSGKIAVTFSFTFNGEPLVFDGKTYTIASGNVVKIDNIQYFVSDPVFVAPSGQRHGFSGTADRIHYVDSDLPATLQWNMEEGLEAGVYDYVEFVYGVHADYNHTGMFPDTPESLMFWPEVLGGGYHHLKLNGWYTQSVGDTVFYPFGFHAGTDTNSVHLRDTVRIFLTDGFTKTLNLNMEVANWFQNPTVWDFGKFGGSVMQNQEAQRVIKENAHDVFSIE